MIIAGVLLPAAPWAAFGAAPGTDAPTQLVGLFLQGCLRFAGHPAALREWAHGNGLSALPEQGRAAFLHGAPGQAFDASVAGTKLVLVSSDDGICSTVTDQATGKPLIDALEDGLRQAGLRFRLVIERDDQVVSAIHDREYLAAEGSHGWRILLAVVKGDRGGEAMLTAAPE
ncbi:NMCC_0638 family (lipo)protein [Rhodopila sp.]|uniref:NMCC_0638 family (lipo)protein n=1 Tax=Rhodopila sp. TaxID=2480087 RepID=UPI003D103DFB